MNFTQLVGEFGRVSGGGAGSIIITTTDNRVLGSGHLQPDDVGPVVVTAPIPANVNEIVVVMQNYSNNARFAFADAQFLALPVSPPPLPAYNFLQQGTLLANTMDAGITVHPQNGAFIMDTNFYERGLTFQTAAAGNIRRISYNIEGLGFTALTGFFGQVTGTGGGSLFVTSGNAAIGFNRLLFPQYTLAAGLPPGSGVQSVNIPIPAGTTHITISVQGDAPNSVFGFGNAMFVTDGTAPPLSTVAEYLQGDIMAVTMDAGLVSHPFGGRFDIQNNAQSTFFRGVSIQAGSAPAGIRRFTYNIAGRGFVRLEGTFGLISPTGSGSVVISTTQGRVLETQHVTAGDPIPTFNIAADIPTGTTGIVIAIQSDANNVRLGFGDARFVLESPPVPPGSNLMSLSNSSVIQEETFNVALRIDHNEGLHSLGVDIEFDPVVFAFDPAATAGTGLMNLVAPGATLIDFDGDSVYETVRILFNWPTGNPPNELEGVLANISFEVLDGVLDSLSSPESPDFDVQPIERYMYLIPLFADRIEQPGNQIVPVNTVVEDGRVIVQVNYGDADDNDIAGNLADAAVIDAFLLRLVDPSADINIPNADVDQSWQITGADSLRIRLYEATAGSDFPYGLRINPNFPLVPPSMPLPEPLSIFAYGEADVYTVQAQIGEYVDVNINIGQNTGFTRLGVQLDYDPTSLRLVAVTPQIDGLPFVMRSADNSRMLFQTEDLSAVSADGVLAAARFEVLCGTNTAINAEVFETYRVDGLDIVPVSMSASGGYIEIVTPLPEEDIAVEQPQEETEDSVEDSETTEDNPEADTETAYGSDEPEEGSGEDSAAESAPETGVTEAQPEEAIEQLADNGQSGENTTAASAFKFRARKGKAGTQAHRAGRADSGRAA